MRKTPNPRSLRRTKFKKFLEAHAAAGTKPFGDPNKETFIICNECPLAKCFGIKVYSHTWNLEELGARLPLPRWADLFRRDFDRTPWLTTPEEVSATDALALLKLSTSRRYV